MAHVIDRARLLAHLRGDEERAVGARIVDAAAQALTRGEPVSTDFLDPFGQEIAAGILESIAEISYKTYGGYPRAERKRYSIFPQYFLTELIEEPIGALDIERQSSFVELGHRDFLGAVIATGIAREKIGDIIVTPRGAQAVVAIEVLSYLADHLTEVGSSGVTVGEIDLERLEVEPERVKDIKTTVASMRLDAIASSGFGTSRTKMAREIKSERVKLNWQAVNNPSREVELGDVVSMRGRGRIVVDEIFGTTRKGRISVGLKRYN